ncbi:MAG TPA: YdcF family protein [Pyrinomonadaceae bacterium]|nr:YdcF family protein [Pyrinomonadaceae bacterium]
MTKRFKAIIGLVLFAVAVAVWIAAAPLLADHLIDEMPLEKADVILILSGGANYAERAEGGSKAFHSGKAPLIWITDDGQQGGWDNEEKRNPFFVEKMNTALLNSGVPGSAIERLPGGVSGTGGEAELAIKTAKERGYRSILVVTSDFHSKRALWIFDQAAAADKAELTIGLLRAPSSASYPSRSSWWLSLAGWQTVAAEYVKFGYYWLYYSF